MDRKRGIDAFGLVFSSSVIVTELVIRNHPLVLVPALIGLLSSLDIMGRAGRYITPIMGGVIFLGGLYNGDVWTAPLGAGMLINGVAMIVHYEGMPKKGKSNKIK